MTISSNVEYLERGCRKGVRRLCREEVEKKYCQKLDCQKRAGDRGSREL